MLERGFGCLASTNTKSRADISHETAPHTQRVVVVVLRVHSSAIRLFDSISIPVAGTLEADKQYVAWLCNIGSEPD